jgi:hypothetical protein
MQIINPPHEMDFEITQEWDAVGTHDHIPPVTIRVTNGEQWVKLLDDDNWLWLGHCPAPQTRWEWFVYHVAHGLLMRYPLHKILPYAWKHCTPATEIDEFD